MLAIAVQWTMPTCCQTGPCCLLNNLLGVQDAQALFMSDMSTSAMADKVLALQNAAGIKAPLVNPRGSGVKAITLTGWGALAALTALITLIVGGSYFAYRKYVSPDPSYVMVSKSGDV